MSEEAEVKVPTKAKIIKDIDELIKETQVTLVVRLAECGSVYGAFNESIVKDIEYLKRVKEALK